MSAAILSFHIRFLKNTDDVTTSSLKETNKCLKTKLFRKIFLQKCLTESYYEEISLLCLHYAIK